jgi:DNA-directed RNA polymerase sigma subunit (sigma70/sigma32)
MDADPIGTAPERAQEGNIGLMTPIGEEGDSHIGDLIEDKDAILPDQAAIAANLRETTTRVLASLTAREERIVRSASDRYGIRIAG